MTKLLVIDDKENIQKVLKMILEKEGYCVETASSGKEGLSRALSISPDIIISDIRMDDMDGTEIFQLLRSRGKSIPFIFITAFASIKGAVNAIKKGAADYITKPIDYSHLKKTIKTVLKKSSSMKSVPGGSRNLVGSSHIMQQLYKRIEIVAGTSSTILITGESGTGKELVARAVHNESTRKDNPFIPLNCSALSMSLLESELFGHEKGAFTGAIAQKKGVFELADKGTLFLDEISEIDISIQVKLLRILQERCFNRVGGSEPVNIDVRLIAATNKNLEKLIAEGTFRKDLFYRLNVIPILVPPLRKHLDDLMELTEHFTRNICRREIIDIPELTPEFIDGLSKYTWPGNIRELENLIERILILYRPAVLKEEYLDRELSASGRSKMESERDRIITTLQLCKGNKTETAKILDMPRRTLYNRIDKYKILREEYLNI
jgi:DNA-binding NtrC family response regulator